MSSHNTNKHTIKQKFMLSLSVFILVLMISGTSSASISTQSDISTNLASVPTAPVLDLLSTNVDRVVLNWTTPFDGGSALIGYKLYYSDALGNPQNLISSSILSTANVYSDQGLIKGQQYCYLLVATNAVGDSGYSNPLCAKAISWATYPATLTYNSGSTFVDLIWTAPPDDGGSPITGYAVGNSTSIYGPFTNIAVVSATTFEYNVTGLTNGVKYNFSIQAINEVGPGAPRTVPVIPYTIATEVLNIQVAYGISWVDLTWQAPTYFGGDTSVSYNIYYAVQSFASPADNFVNSVSTTQLEYNLTTLSMGNTYFFEVVAINVVGPGPAQQFNVTLPNVPDQVGAIAVSNVDLNVTLSWDAPGDGGLSIETYNIYRTTNPGIPFSLLAETNETTYSDLTVQEGMTYYYAISAVNKAGEGLMNETVAITIAVNTTTSSSSVSSSSSSSSSSTSTTPPANTTPIDTSDQNTNVGLPFPVAVMVLGLSGVVVISRKKSKY